MNDNCIFCKIISGEAPSYTIWEDNQHLAFLSIFPNTEGVTVVVPKKHYESYAFNLPDDILSELILATKKVAKILDSKLEDVGRTAMVFEGYGVNHVHSKLFPMHGTKDMTTWRPIEATVDTYFDIYPGYISSHDYKHIDGESLSKVASKLKNPSNS